MCFDKENTGFCKLMTNVDLFPETWNWVGEVVGN